MGEGYPARSHWGVPQPGPDGEGYPNYVQIWGYPRVSPQQGVPPSRVLPPGRGYPPPQYRTIDRVLDAPRSVCLLCSRRRTFLFNYSIRVERTLDSSFRIILADIWGNETLKNLLLWELHYFDFRGGGG